MNSAVRPFLMKVQLKKKKFVSLVNSAQNPLKKANNQKNAQLKKKKKKKGNANAIS